MYFLVASLSVLQINPFSPRPSHSATESQSIQISVNIFSLSILPGGPEPSLSDPDNKGRMSTSKCLKK